MADEEKKTNDDEREIKLVGDDDISVKIKVKLLKKFSWFAGMINFKPNKNVFTFDHVSGKNFERILEWMTYEASGMMSALIDPETNSFRKLTTWEENFTESMNDEELVELMIHADYFSMNNFLEILTTVTALRIVTYPIDKIRTMFHIIESGYSPQEEQKLESEIQWALRFQD